MNKTTTSTQTQIFPDGAIWTLEGSTITLANNPVLPDRTFTFPTTREAGIAWLEVLIH